MSELKFNASFIIERAVEEGVQYGVRRAFKHTETATVFARYSHLNK